MLDIYPLHLFENPSVYLACKSGNGEKQKMDAASTRILMLITRQFATDGGFDLQLFPKLPDQRLLGSFAGFDFSPRKLPFERMAIRSPALSDQDLSIPMDNAG